MCEVYVLLGRTKLIKELGQGDAIGIAHLWHFAVLINTTGLRDFHVANNMALAVDIKIKNLIGNTASGKPPDNKGLLKGSFCV